MFEGRNINGFVGKKAVIAWDHHQVLDTFRKGRSAEHSTYQDLPQQTQQVIELVHRGFPVCQFAQVVLSYCHHPDTVANVRRLCTPREEFIKVYISRKPTGQLGKLAILRSVFDLSKPLFHIDDSPEVCTEIRDFLRKHKDCNWKVIQIKCGKKRLVSGIPHCANVREAAEVIFAKTGLAV